MQRAQLHAWGAVAATLATGAVLGLGIAIESVVLTMIGIVSVTGLMFVLGTTFKRAGFGLLLVLAAIWGAVGIAGVVARFWPLAVWIVPAIACVAYDRWQARRRARWHRVGKPARATVLDAERTGTVINNYVLVWKVRLRIEPDDGAAPFEGTKRMRLPLPGSVEPGQRLSALVDPERPGEFVIDDR